MTAIAQTLDGTVAFETKKELFDYVFSQLFEQDWTIFHKTHRTELQTYISRQGEKERIRNFATKITTRGNVSYHRHHEVNIELEINRLPITKHDYDMLTTKELPTIKYLALNGCVYTYTGNRLYGMMPESYELFPNPTKFLDLKIQSEDVKLEIE